MSAWSCTVYSYFAGLSENPMPSMSGAITVKRSVNLSHNGAQSHELKG